GTAPGSLRLPRGWPENPARAATRTWRGACEAAPVPGTGPPGPLPAVGQPHRPAAGRGPGMVAEAPAGVGAPGLTRAAPCEGGSWLHRGHTGPLRRPRTGTGRSCSGDRATAGSWDRNLVPVGALCQGYPRP